MLNAWPIFGGTDPAYSAQDDQGGDHGDHSPFGRSVNRYRLAGWLGTLPLPAGKKNPPPTGYTGHQASHPTRAQIAAWVGDPARRGANICLRLAGIDCAPENRIDAFEVVGIDVDHYAKGGKDKRGGDQLAKLEAELGPLPATWISSARVDGTSGIRYFRVPAGLTFRGQVAADIECIYRGYRFAVVWPSTNPDAGGATYWWFPPGTTPNAGGRKAWNSHTDVLPKPADLPLLPDAWIDHLTQGRMSATADPIDMDSSVDELYAWADATFNDSAGDAMCGRVEKSFHTLKAEIAEDATSHDKIVKAHWHIYRLAAEGHTGWKDAIDQIETVYRDEVTARDKRGRDELRGEIFRSRTNALRKTKGVVDQAAEIGARYTPRHCTCVVPEGLTVPKAIVLRDIGDNPVQIIELGDSTRQASRSDSILTVLGPAEWAQPVPPTEFLIAKVLCADTFGVNAGPKKSLKTHDNQAIAFAVASGIDLYRNPLFPVRRTGSVLYIVGEGGVNPVRRTMHRMARAYGLDPADIARDPDFGLIPAFGAAPIDSEAFRDELRRLLDTHQPELVLIESFYNFHPKDVEAANLFSRGQVIDGHHKFIRSECHGATSIMTDHYRSTGGKSLDLDNISMAGQAENADSWITRIHRKEPDVAAGEFTLRTGFASRQWGGTEWHIGWHLGAFDHDAGHHIGEISWDVQPADSSSAKPGNATHGGDAHTTAGRCALILDYIDAHDMETKTAVCEQLAKAHNVGAKKFLADFNRLVNDRQIDENRVTVTRPYGGVTRNKTIVGWKRSMSATPVASVGSSGA
uniref:DNA primase/polymerase bifunctional N-terminal domain-containing protein n=1 Tax=Mycobacterium sp. (strain JLS) TaxID=164757 RepID=A0A5Q5CIZ3_MYCSJ